MSASEVKQKVIPPLKSNPFSAKPLERQQQGLFVGRRDIILELSRLIRSKSPRIMVLVGERGSGRTSLIQCLAPHSPKHYSHTLFPEIEPSKRLLEELYANIVDFEVPLLTNVLVEQLISSVNANSGELPLITFDYGGTPGGNTKEVFQRLSQVLRRLNALTIVALTPTQLSAWPEELINEFDKVVELQPLNLDETSDLVKSRINPEIRGHWTPPTKLIELVQDRTGGKVQEVIRLMRDVVEYLRGGGLANDEVLLLLENLEIEEINQDEINEDILLEDEEEYVQTEPETKIDEEEKEEAPDVEGDYYEEEEEYEPEPEEEFEQEDLEIKIDEETKDTEQYPQEYVGGTFGRLAMRNKEAMKEVPRIESNQFERAVTDTNTQPEPPSLDAAQIQTPEASLWIAEGIKDQFVEQMQRLDEGPGMQTNDEIGKSDSGGGFLSRLHNLNPNSETRTVSEFPLQPNHLRNLDYRESILIDLAAKREFSPSDDELKNRLDVGRSRISQICTPLLKSGILVARISGRSRYYTLSSSAKSQLIAWGVING